jgi:SAM-dependent methyltransferase
MGNATESARVPEEKVDNPFFARIYLRMASGPNARGEDRYRRELLAGLSGRVIEVGSGNGLNFPLYPETVDEVVAVEPEARLREEATKNAPGASVAVRVIDAVSGRLPFEDEAFDAGVASLVLCSVPDQQRALAEFRRVIRPGGELRFYEHVVAEARLPAGLQRAADATFWPRVGGGCHLARDTQAASEAAGFTIEQRKRFAFSPGAPIPPLPHILGVARRR